MIKFQDFRKWVVGETDEIVETNIEEETEEQEQFNYDDNSSFPDRFYCDARSLQEF